VARLIVTASLAALVAASAGSSAVAAGRLITQAAPVKTSDLNLATEHDARVFLRRVNVAASEMCAISGAPYFGTSFNDEVKCHEQAVARAVSRLDAPVVTAEYARRHHVVPPRTASR
jgi:UrcA family protein